MKELEIIYLNRNVGSDEGGSFNCRKYFKIYFFIIYFVFY